MTFPFLCLTALSVLLFCVPLPGNAQVADSGNKAHNPILWADVPDMSIVRVGDTYYMSSTTMHMSPGVPIMKSHDLVNWELASYAYETLADNDALNLKDGKNAYGQGSWASSLRYHQGTFYVSTFSSTTGRTHIYSTRDPNRTPWKETSFAPSFHDNSLFFDDDGRVYLIHGAGNLRLTELNADLTGVKTGGIDQVIVPNASEVAGKNVGLPAEGSQMYKINGKYYLCNITWPRNDMRTEIVHRADTITGPYTGKVLLHDRGVAQGGFIDTPDGKWYAYLFQDHGAVGRIPFLVPVQWSDGWPIAGIDGKVPETLDLPTATTGVKRIIGSDEFARKRGERPLPLAWQWNHNPDNVNWSLTANPGWLRLTTGRVDAELTQARNTLTQRTFGPECSTSTLLDVTHLNEGDYAGLVALQKKYGFVGVTKTGGNRFIVMVSAQSNTPEEIARIPLSQNKLYLKIDCDFKERHDRAYFYYSLNGKDWSSIGEPLRMVYDLPHFMGYRYGLFHFATKQAGGQVDFDYFRISDSIMSPQ